MKNRKKIKPNKKPTKRQNSRRIKPQDFHVKLQILQPEGIYK